MLDLVVRSTRVYARGAWLDGWVGVRDGRVAALGARELEAPAAREVVDVGQRHLLPGLVDTHTHVRDPGFTHKEDWTSATSAAAVGGVTTVFDMPNVEPPPNTVERFLAHRENAAAKAIVDFGHNVAGTIVEQIRPLAEAGASAFKIFMMTDVGRSYPHMPGIAVDDPAKLFELFGEIAATGRPVLVHPHDQRLYELFVRRAQERWGRDYRSYARAWMSGDGIVFDSGISTAILLQRETGVRLHILHVATVGGLRLARDAKAAGRAVSIETNPHMLFLANSWENIERLGPYSLGFWVPDHHASAVWQALVDGSSDLIATDHAPHTREEKEVGWTDMYRAPGGSPCIQHYLSLLLTEVNRGRISLERVIALCAERPAQLMGLEGRKGTIEPGADADFVVVDLDRRETITLARSLSKCGWTPYDGREVHGVPVMTFLRGTCVAREGKVLVRPGFGRFVDVRRRS